MPRQAGLDLIRAAAIVWVMIYHASLFDLISNDWTLVAFGWMGVDLFFVLSGFLVAGQLLQPVAQGQSPDFTQFFMRRVLRTLPAFLAMLAVYFSVPAWRERPDIQPFWQFLTFTQNLFIRLDTFKAFSHVWSLCVEEQFYVILPLALLYLRRRPSATIVVSLLLGLCLAGMVLRGTLWLEAVGHPLGALHGTPDPRAYLEWIYYPTWSRLDGLLAGIALALIRVFRPGWWRELERRSGRITLVGVGGLYASIAFFGGQVAPFWPVVLGYPMLAISLAMLVAAAAMPHSTLGRLQVPGAQSLAIGAYSLYLSHKMVFHGVKVAAGGAGHAGPIGLAVALCLAVAAGALLYFCVERPFLVLRERIANGNALASDTGKVARFG